MNAEQLRMVEEINKAAEELVDWPEDVDEPAFSKGGIGDHSLSPQVVDAMDYRCYQLGLWALKRKLGL